MSGSDAFDVNAPMYLWVMKTKTNYSLHIAFWLIKDGLEFAFFSYPYLLKEPPLIFWRNTILVWSLYVSFFYLNYCLFLPRFLLLRRYVPFFISVAFSILVFLAALGLMWNGYRLQALLEFPGLYPQVAFNAVTLFFGSTALRMFEQWQKSEEKKQMLQQEVREAELLYLKSQMSPHFLFNTLNNIYGLSLKKSNGTSMAIAQLKRMLLYVQNFKEGAGIYLKEEVTHLESFIALNALRYDCQVNFDTQIKEDMLIEPMIFLPFIENAFKHGDTGSKAQIDIGLETRKDQVLFTLRNKIDKNKRKDATGGIGIQNIRRRLDLLYGKKWSMETKVNENHYFVHLTVPCI